MPRTVSDKESRLRQEQQWVRRDDPILQFLRLAKNSVANLLRLAAGWIILLIVPPFLVRLLDKPDYAAWMLILQLGAYATFFDGGVQLAIGRYVARADQNHDRQYLGQILSSAATLLTLAATFLCIVIVIVALQLSHIFSSIPASIAPQSSRALLLIGISLSITLPFSVFPGFCLGIEKNEINAAAGSIARFAGAAGTLWAAWHHQGLVRMALWTAIGNLLLPLLFALGTRRFALRSLLRLRFVSLPVMRGFAGFCSATMASQFSSLLISGLDVPIVAAFDFHNAGYYAVAALASNLLVVPQGAILSTIVPMMSSMTTGQQADHMGRVLVRTTRISTAMLSVVAVPLMLGMPIFLHLWVGNSYARHSILFAELLLAAQFIRLTLMPYTLIGFSAGEQKHMLVSPVAEGIVNLASSLLLVRICGAAGVAIGTLIGALVGVILHFTVSMKRTPCMAFPRRSLFWSGILVPLSPALLPAALLAISLPFSSTIGTRIALLSATVLVLLLIFWKRQLLPDERMLVCAMASRLLPARLSSRILGA